MTTYNLLLILILIVAIALILIVMVQNPKGGGLSSSFGGGGAQNIGGVQNTNTFLDKTTWTLAITMFALKHQIIYGDCNFCVKVPSNFWRLRFLLKSSK